MAPSSRTSKRNLLILASGLLLVLLSVAFVDRAASTWSHATLHRMPVFDWLTHIVDPLPPAAAYGLALAGCAAAFTGWRPGEKSLTLLACCLSVVVAIAIKEQLKYAFGRTWPEVWTGNNPSWIGNGTYGFFFFHGGEGWYSFPSGHMTIITSAMAVLWRRVPAWRWLWVIPIVAVAVGLLGSDYHFVGDMIAGTYLGAVCAAGVLAFIAWLGERGRRSDDRAGRP